MHLPLSVWIRTHTQRLYLANRLETMCNQTFDKHAEILYTGDASLHHSLKFAVCLANRLARETEEYTLLMEDDISLTDSSFEAVSRAIERGDDHNWYTVDTTTDILSHSIYVPEYGYVLTNAQHINYSGAILVRSEILREYIDYYFTRAMELEFLNFDTNFSAYLLRSYGNILLRPGHFTQKLTPSSVRSESAGRAERALGETYEYRGPVT